MNLRDAAVNLARSGLFVFPLWRAIDGRCEAPWSHECKALAKHSRVKWKGEASRDPEQVWNWWSKWPEAGIGIATGPSNLAILDVDPKNGGLESFENLCTLIPRLDKDVPKVQTGTGFHLYFAQPQHGEIRNTEGKRNGIAPGIDTRGIGGFVVAPPSIHANGNAYRWERELHFPLEPFPDELVQILRQHSKQDAVERRQSATPLFQMAEGVLIPEGTRNGAFASYAGKLRVAGMDPEEMFLFLKWLRDQHCENPETFTDAEIVGVIRQSYTYERIAWPAYMKHWLRSSPTGQDLKYLSSIAVLQGENVSNPAISTIHKLSGMPKSTQLHCRQRCEDKGLLRAIPGTQGKAAQITLLPPMLSDGPKNVPIIKTWNEDRSDRSLLSEEKVNPPEGRPLQIGAAVAKERPKAVVTEIFSRPRKRHGKRRKPNKLESLPATG